MIGEPHFYARAAAFSGATSFGAADNAMLIRVANRLADYLQANYTEAVGGRTGADLESNPPSRLLDGRPPHSLCSSSMSDPLINRLKHLIVTTLKLEDVSPAQMADDEPLIGSGLNLDSIDALELVVTLGRSSASRFPAAKSRGRPSPALHISLDTFAPAPIPGGCRPDVLRLALCRLCCPLPSAFKPLAASPRTAMRRRPMPR